MGINLRKLRNSSLNLISKVIPHYFDSLSSTFREITFIHDRQAKVQATYRKICHWNRKYVPQLQGRRSFRSHL